MLSQASAGTAIDANVVSAATTIIASNGARAVTATIAFNGATIVKKGTCGENLTWTLNSSGTLNISGKGEMYAYVNWYEDVPWYSQKNSIKKVVVGKGVTNICEDAFNGCTNLR